MNDTNPSIRKKMKRTNDRDCFEQPYSCLERLLLGFNQLDYIRLQQQLHYCKYSGANDDSRKTISLETNLQKVFTTKGNRRYSKKQTPYFCKRKHLSIDELLPSIKVWRKDIQIRQNVYKIFNVYGETPKLESILVTYCEILLDTIKAIKFIVKEEEPALDVISDSGVIQELLNVLLLPSNDYHLQLITRNNIKQVEEVQYHIIDIFAEITGVGSTEHTHKIVAEWNLLGVLGMYMNHPNSDIRARTFWILSNVTGCCNARSHFVNEHNVSLFEQLITCIKNEKDIEALKWQITTLSNCYLNRPECTDILKEGLDILLSQLSRSEKDIIMEVCYAIKGILQIELEINCNDILKRLVELIMINKEEIVQTSLDMDTSGFYAKNGKGLVQVRMSLELIIVILEIIDRICCKYCQELLQLDLLSILKELILKFDKQEPQIFKYTFLIIHSLLNSNSFEITVSELERTEFVHFFNNFIDNNHTRVVFLNDLGQVLTKYYEFKRKDIYTRFLHNCLKLFKHILTDPKSKSEILTCFDILFKVLDIEQGKILRERNNEWATLLDIISNFSQCTDLEVKNKAQSLLRIGAFNNLSI
ncbi:hypothetical protein ABK040_007567 [Willaertia magna]